jgi:hypothetical protein
VRQTTNRSEAMKNEIHETENLTEKEINALIVIIHGDHSNLGDDCTAVWAQPSDLIQQGYSKHEAAGLWSSLLEKGSLDLYEERDKSEGGDLFTVMNGHLPTWKQEYIEDNA